VSTSGPYDAIIIGGGHNGLVCATFLARGGRKVLVLEAAATPGGAAVTREFAPGFKVSSCAHLLHLMPPALMRELGLQAQGLKIAAEALPTVALSEDAQHLSLGTGELSALERVSPADAAALREWQALMRRISRALHPVLAQTPPRLGTDAWRDRAALLGIGWRVRRLGRKDMRELLRIGGMCVHDLLEDRFRLPLLKGALALDAVLGTNLGPRSPGTVVSLLYRLAAVQGAEALALPQSPPAPRCAPTRPSKRSWCARTAWRAWCSPRARRSPPRVSSRAPIRRPLSLNCSALSTSMRASRGA
jgi:phytoene dehydrogenase-like protein